MSHMVKPNEPLRFLWLEKACADAQALAQAKADARAIKALFNRIYADNGLDELGMGEMGAMGAPD